MMSDHELDSLHFECQGCGSCCSGESGYVFLSEKETQNISDYLEMSTHDFLKKYTHWVKFKNHFRLSLKEEENFDCIFLKDKHCLIYNARPLQCKAYPFWERIIQSQETWEEEKIYCHGINKGESIPFFKISEFILSQRKIIYIKR